MNSYDKPKVTIDLDEYNELNRKIKALSDDSLLVMHKEVIAAILNSRNDRAAFALQLRQKNIYFQLVNTEMSRHVETSNIVIEKIADNG